MAVCPFVRIFKVSQDGKEVCFNGGFRLAAQPGVIVSPPFVVHHVGLPLGDHDIHVAAVLRLVRLCVAMLT